MKYSYIFIDGITVHFDEGAHKDIEEIKENKIYKVRNNGTVLNVGNFGRWVTNPVMEEYFNHQTL